MAAHLHRAYGFSVILGPARVLIAEDEARLAAVIARGLRREGMAVDLAADGSDALFKARVVRYDVLVLDRDLPLTHGDEVCRTLREERPDTGILMLTAAGAVEDLVHGLSLGADDYHIATLVYSLAQNQPTVIPGYALIGAPLAGVLIGAAAGLYPARQAARLSPTEALRSG